MGVMSRMALRSLLTAEAAPSRSPAEVANVLANEVARWNRSALLPGFADASR
jgi:hypothetical protein